MKDKLLKFLPIIVCVIMIVLLIGVIFLRLWVLYEYGDTPLNEIPAWAYLLLYE